MHLRGVNLALDDVQHRDVAVRLRPAENGKGSSDESSGKKRRETEAPRRKTEVGHVIGATRPTHLRAVDTIMLLGCKRRRITSRTVVFLTLLAEDMSPPATTGV